MGNIINGKYVENFKTERIYFVSQFDNRIHNIHDVEHQIIDEKNAYIGKDCSKYGDGFRVDEEVNLWTATEILKFFEI